VYSQCCLYDVHEFMSSRDALKPLVESSDPATSVQNSQVAGVCCWQYTRLPCRGPRGSLSDIRLTNPLHGGLHGKS
jgi:hypothetical protein